MNHLQNLVHGHLEAKWTQNPSNSQFLEDPFRDLTREETGIELEIGPLFLLQAIFIGNKNTQMH